MNALLRPRATVETPRDGSGSGANRAFLWRPETDHVGWSQGLYDLFQFEPGSSVTRARVVACVHPDDLPLVHDLVERARGGAGRLELEHRIILLDDSIRYVRIVGHGVREQEGDLAYIGSVEDVTAQRTSGEGPEASGLGARLAPSARAELRAPPATSTAKGAIVANPVRERPVIPKVFVVDADAAVRESLQTLIRKSGWAVETFASASQLLAKGRPIGPTCLILDTDLPDGNALDVQERVVRDGWVMPIVFTSAHGDVRMAVRAIKAGAIEVLLKPLISEVLLGAINEALERSRAALVEESDLRALEARYASLSSREQQVLGLVVRGFLNKQVGGALGISEITVKGHRGSMMRKMQANSLADLVNMAARLRLPRAGAEVDARPTPVGRFASTIPPSTTAPVRSLVKERNACPPPMVRLDP